MQVDGIISEYKEQGQRGARIRSRPSSHTLRWINRTRPCSRRNQLKFPSQIKDSHELSTQHLAQANTCPGLFEMRVVSSHTAAPSIECDSGHRLCFSLGKAEQPASPISLLPRLQFCLSDALRKSTLGRRTPWRCSLK